VSLSEQGNKRIVVELNQFPAPENQGGKRAGKYEVHGTEETLGPIFDFPERSRTPIMSPDKAGHLTLAEDHAVRGAVNFLSF
jgi:hypothetical protein